MNIRKVLLLLHRYLGLVAAVPLILAALSGAVLVFEVELDRCSIRLIGRCILKAPLLRGRNCSAMFNSLIRTIVSPWCDHQPWPEVAAEFGP